MKGMVLLAAAAIFGTAYMVSGNAGRPGIERTVSRPAPEVYAELSRFADGMTRMKMDGVCIDARCDRTATRTVTVEKDAGKSIVLKWMQGPREIFGATAQVAAGDAPATASLRVSTSGEMARMPQADETVGRMVDNMIGKIERGEPIPTGRALFSTVETTPGTPG